MPPEAPTSLSTSMLDNVNRAKDFFYKGFDTPPAWSTTVHNKCGDAKGYLESGKHQQSPDRTSCPAPRQTWSTLRMQIIRLAHQASSSPPGVPAIADGGTVFDYGTIAGGGAVFDYGTLAGGSK